MAKSKRGFASMPEEQRKKIASSGGTAAHSYGVAHEWTTDEARATGRKGGMAHSAEHLAEIGRKGGLKRAENARRKAGR